MMTPLPDVMTAGQLAELLDCTPETVEERTRDRQLPGVKYGRGWVYPKAAVLQVLAQQALAHVATPAAAGQRARQAPANVQPIAAAPRRADRVRGKSPAPLPDPPAGVR